jgi:hypothetical protein
MRKVVLVALAAIAAGLSAPVAAQSGEAVVVKSPGAVGMARTMQVTATISAIDKASRTVVLKGPKGRELAVSAGPEVKNFDQLKQGDQVEVQYLEALALELRKGGGKAVARTEEAAGASAAKGAAPGAAAGRKVTVVGDVINVDAATKTVTVRGPKRTLDLQVDDPEQLKRIAKGDQIEATYVEAVAVAVTPKK